MIQFLTKQHELEAIPERQQMLAIVLALAAMLIVLELVRRRRLREEYAWMWIGTSALLIGLALAEGLLVTVSSWIGAASATSTLFFGGIVFLMLLCLQFSVRLSRLTQRHRILGQRMALLEHELKRLRAGRPAMPTPPSATPPAAPAPEHGFVMPRPEPDQVAQHANDEVV